VLVTAVDTARALVDETGTSGGRRKR